MACPTCGRDNFNSERAMRIHHEAKHGESLSKKEVDCSNCGNKLYIQEWERKKKDKHFCDKYCYGEWTSENRVGKDSPVWKGGKVEVKCQNCGKTEKRIPARAEGNCYCSPSCYFEDRDYVTGENHWRWKGGMLEVGCSWCGNQIKRNQYRVRNRSQHFFCSDDCNAKWKQENLTGKNNPAWKGGHGDYYGRNWLKQRRKTLRRDSYSCVVCENSDIVHIHHIVPFRKFDSYVEANKLSNLVALCSKHHKYLEGEESLKVKEIKQMSPAIFSSS